MIALQGLEIREKLLLLFVGPHDVTKPTMSNEYLSTCHMMDYPLIIINIRDGMFFFCL